jgi:hypothetical protein
MFELLTKLFCGLAVISPFAMAQAAEPPIAGVKHQIVWVPSYLGEEIRRYEIDYTVSPAKFTSKTIALKSNAHTKNCNPNSVAVEGGSLYIVCNSDQGNSDRVLVLNYTTYAYEKTITGEGPSGVGSATLNYFTGSSLIGIAFDSHKNLWLSGYNSNSLYRIPAAQLSKAHPQVDRQVVDSPDLPAGMVFDKSGSLWVVGQYSGGILLEFPDATINQNGTYLNSSPLNPNPALCLSNVLTGCNPTTNLFNNPEGVAIFDGSVWISNNGGNAPAATLVRAIANTSTGVFTTSTFGSVANKPFACPGGLFAPTLAGATPELWVNDEGFGFTNGTCGATAASQGSDVGIVDAFTAGDLVNHQTAPKREVFPGSTKLKTGSPGFGGIFVQLN